jgi:hypothetical protein
MHIRYQEKLASSDTAHVAPVAHKQRSADRGERKKQQGPTKALLDELVDV